MKESLLPVKATLKSTDKIRIVNNDSTPSSATVLVSTLNIKMTLLAIALG